MTDRPPASSLVLFDIDGTLIRNAGGHHKQALMAGIRSITGVETTLNGISTTGMLDRDLIRQMLLSTGQNEEQIRSSMNDIVAACQASYLRNCSADLTDRICPGLPDLLHDLQMRGAALGLVTGNLSAIAWKKMELTRLRTFFSVGAFSEHARNRARLARAAFVRAIRDRLVDKSCRVSLIGDHANDIAAAKANKFLAIAVATGLMPYDELKQHKPDILLHDLTELDPALLV